VQPEPKRIFSAGKAERGEEPLSIGVIGPPGGGKSLSSLLLAKGIQSVRGGRIKAIDTEGGRLRKFADSVDFDIVEFNPPCRSDHLLQAIKQQVADGAAVVIVDSMSDEHEGEGGYLEWHDDQVPKMGGNDWAAWAVPKAARKRLINGILRIKVPLIFTFRAREKTQQSKNEKGKTVVNNIGWQPVAPLEIVHGLDLTCILPPRANGVPVWKSDRVGEDFIIKLPFYLAPYIAEGKALCEDMGRAFALWAKGLPSPPAPNSETALAEDSSVIQAPGESEATEAEQIIYYDTRLAAAALNGSTADERLDALKKEWENIPAKFKSSLKAAKDRRHKPAAIAGVSS